jgi:phosphoserine phosphatase
MRAYGFEVNTRTHLLITVSGKDSPGITSGLMEILAHYRVEILDITQAVIHGLLSLSIVFQLPEGTQREPVLKDLLFRCTELNLKLEYKVLSELSEPALSRPLHRYAVTLIASSVPAQALHRVTHLLAQFRLNIDKIERLSDNGFGCVEMIVSAHSEVDSLALKKDLLTIARELDTDIALQEEGLYRRAKRLVVLDMDSTLIQNEVIDEFARERGVYEKVAAITEEAMRGGLPFDEALNRRVAELKGLTTAEIQNVISRIELTPGADELIAILKRLGYKTAVISGGFGVVADHFKERLKLDYAFANTLEFDSGVATGKVMLPIVNAHRKADLLEQIAASEGIDLDQVVAIGDGANDLLMLERAGLGIAFNAKPVVREQADTAISQKNLKTVLYLLGISGRDLADLH